MKSSTTKTNYTCTNSVLTVQSSLYTNASIKYSGINTTLTVRRHVNTFINKNEQIIEKNLLLPTEERGK